MYAEKALDLIRRRTPQVRPFFLWLAFLAPHSGGCGSREILSSPLPVPAPRHRDHFAAEPLPAPPSLNEADVSDKPVGIRSRPLLRPGRVAQIRGVPAAARVVACRRRGGCRACIVGELERLGELDRTLVIFTSDNGFFHGEHRVPSGKVLVYEPSIRVPLICAASACRQGRRHQPVSNIDVAPTILDVAGARAARRMDGRSPVPLLRDLNLGWGRATCSWSGGRATARSARS